MKTTEAVIATNGNAYYVDHKTGKAKKVFNSLAELKFIKEELIKNNKISFNAYLSYVRTELSGEPIKVAKNSFMVKGFKFVFHSDHIECRDVLNYGLPVKFEDVPTPKDLVVFLKAEKKEERKFSSSEMCAAAERGKKLLEEKIKVNVETLAKVSSSETLEQAKAKALRLITRIKKRQSDNEKIFTEIPGMIKYRPLQTAIGIAVAAYHSKKLRWAKFLDKMETLIKNENFQKKPEVPEKFIGLEIMQYKKVTPFTDMKENIEVDGKLRESGEFYAKYILQRDNSPEVMPQMMKWLKKEITDAEFIEEPVKKDKMVSFDCKLLKGLTIAQAEVLYEVMYSLFLYDTAKIVYNEKDKKYKAGQKILVLYPETASSYFGKIHSIDQGVYAEFEDGVFPLIISQKIKILK